MSNKTYPNEPGDGLPLEILKSYVHDTDCVVRVLGSGSINTTWYIETKQIRMILQRLAPIFAASIMDDYQEVVAHLAKEGWEVALPLASKDGSLTVSDAMGNIWRAMEYINSDTADVMNISQEVVAAYGQLLGRLHKSLQSLDYRPGFRIKHFHDLDYYAHELEKALPYLSALNAREDAIKLLGAYAALPPLPYEAEQLIHGDPRTANILHRAGKPFTFIDWDTLMLGNTWMDIGDMLRSVAENEITLNKPISAATLNQVIDGYRAAAFQDNDPSHFRHTALLAAQTMAIELGMRFAADYKDGVKGYFAWDNTNFNRRHDFTATKARQQLDIYKQIRDIDIL